MKYRKYIYIIVFSLGGVFVSCTSDKDTLLNQQMILHLGIVPPYYEDDMKSVTRTVDVGGASSVLAAFEEGDTVGIFPNKGFQIPFKLPVVGAPVTSVNILADGWDTKSSELYAVYCPFNFANRYYNKIPWDYRGPQKQTGNDKKTHLGKYWFMASDTVSAKVNSSGVAEFGALLINMGAVIRCQTYVTNPCTIVRMILVASTNAFPTYGYYDLFDTSAPKEDVLHKYSGSPVISNPYLHQPFIASGYTDHLTLDFVGGITLAADSRLRGWFVSPEADLKLQTVKLYLWDTDGNCYVCSSNLTNTTGNICRNSVKAISFSDAQLTTTPFTNLNPWEKTETLCPTCTPVAF